MDKTSLIVLGRLHRVWLISNHHATFSALSTLVVEVLRSKNPPKCSDCDKSTKFHTRVPFHLLNHIRGTPQAILTRKMSKFAYFKMAAK